MSPFRNPVPRHIRWANHLLDKRWMTTLLHKLARSAGVRDVAADWRIAHGPWFGNGAMTVTLSGEDWAVEVDHAELRGERQLFDRTLTYGRLDSPSKRLMS